MAMHEEGRAAVIVKEREAARRRCVEGKQALCQIEFSVESGLVLARLVPLLARRGGLAFVFPSWVAWSSKGEHQGPEAKASPLAVKQGYCSRFTAPPTPQPHSTGSMGSVKGLKGLTALILGPPGGGKGTISKKLLKDFGFLHLSTGDVLRKHVREQTAVGMAAQKFMLTGMIGSCRVDMDGLLALEGVEGGGRREDEAAAGVFVLQLADTALCVCVYVCHHEK